MRGLREPQTLVYKMYWAAVGCWERCLREPQTLVYKMYWAAGRVLGEVSARTSNTAVQDVLGCR